MFQVSDTDGCSIQIYVQQVKWSQLYKKHSLISIHQENAEEEDVNQNSEFEVEDEGGGQAWHGEVQTL